MNTHTHERKIPLRLLAGSGLLFSLMMPGYSQGMPGAPAKPSTVLVQKASTIDSAVNKKYIGQVNPSTGLPCSLAFPATLWPQGSGKGT